MSWGFTRTRSRGPCRPRGSKRSSRKPRSRRSRGRARAPAFVTTRVEDPGLVPELEAAHVRFTGYVANTWLSTLLSWILPSAIFVGLWMFVMKRMNPQSGLMSLGKSRAKVYVEDKTGVSFDDIAGIDEARGELMEIVDFLKNPERYRRLGGKIPKGVLLVGAPGHGQDHAGQGGRRRGRGAVLQPDRIRLRGDVRRGRGGARPRPLRSRRKRKRPASCSSTSWMRSGKARGVSPGFGGHDEHEQTLNQLLAELDGFDTHAGRDHPGGHESAGDPRPGPPAPRPFRSAGRHRSARSERSGEDSPGAHSDGHAGSRPRPRRSSRRGRRDSSGPIWPTWSTKRRSTRRGRARRRWISRTSTRPSTGSSGGWSGSRGSSARRRRRSSPTTRRATPWSPSPETTPTRCRRSRSSPAEWPRSAIPSSSRRRTAI